MNTEHIIRQTINIRYNSYVHMRRIKDKCVSDVLTVCSPQAGRKQKKLMVIRKKNMKDILNCCKLCDVINDMTQKQIEN